MKLARCMTYASYLQEGPHQLPSCSRQRPSVPYCLAAALSSYCASFFVVSDIVSKYREVRSKRKAAEKEVSQRLFVLCTHLGPFRGYTGAMDVCIL